ncbi:MAG: hypothetical protein IJZ75_03680 [Clostridia bacterium]|nr:hypothetical protein [Clostridia bacterium]
MENLDLNKVIDLNESIESTEARLETVKAELSIEEAVREAFSKDLTPKILRHKVRYKRVNGVKVPCTEITIEEKLLDDLVSVAGSQVQLKENYKKLKALGEQLKRETSQTELYKRCVETEAQIKQLKMENMLLEAKVKERDREIAEIYAQGTDPYIDYEEQTYDLEIE